jgi:hypothetical protein
MTGPPTSVRPSHLAATGPAMKQLLADIDWISILGAIGASIATVAAAAGTAGKYLLGYFERMQKAQRDHDSSVISRVDAMGARFETAFRDVNQAHQNEARQTINTLMKIQSETVTAITRQSAQVSEMVKALDDLRLEIARKEDKKEFAEREEAQRLELARYAGKTLKTVGGQP